MNRKSLILTAIVLLLVFGTIFGAIEGKQYLVREYLASYRPPPVTVSAHEARAETWERALGAVGTLKAGRGVDIATETPGILEALSFHPGQQVAAGQELARLDDRVEQATLKSLLAQRRLAEINFERDQRLLATKALSRTDFDKTEAQLKDISAQVERTEGIIARKHITAPFAGRIGIPQVEPGQYLNEGETLVTLQALDTLEVDFSVPEQQLPLLKAGNPIRCRVQAYPGDTFSGSIVAIDAKVDGSTRNVLVRARVPNTELALLPGMFVAVEIIVDAAVPVITVPETAVSYNLYGDAVFVVREREAEEGGTERYVERRYVDIGPSRAGRVAVTEGLQPGELIVTAGSLKLDTGARVVIDNSVELPE